MAPPRSRPALPSFGTPAPDLLPRLARIEGQVRGLSRMVEEARWCPDILTQISAVQAALERVREQLLESHLSHCVTRILDSGDTASKHAVVAEVIEVLKRAR